jgi:hypothetical protein
LIGAGFLYIVNLQTQIRDEDVDEQIITEVWLKNTKLEIDLDRYFSDPDGDELSYTVSDSDNIESEIVGSDLILTPEPDWTGNSSMVVFADDAKGGITETTVNLRVEEGSRISQFARRLGNAISRSFDNVMDFIGAYYAYIITGIIILVIVILVIKYNKPLLDFFEKPK